MKNLAQAIINVMTEVKGVEKGMTVGTGSASYKGVSDYDVKKIIGESMRKNGLSILPISVEPNTRVDRWEETNQYGTKQKQSVFTEVKTKYLLLHSSGESMELAGYGHGVDTQDKGAGKATTYALKYTLLYTFLTPTGAIDDADKEHSDEKEVPKTTAYNHNSLGTKEKPLISNQQFKTACERLKGGEIDIYEKTLNAFTLDATQKTLFEKLKSQLKTA